MALDPIKIGEELGQTWRSSPLIVGMQILTLAVLGFFGWDRVQQRSVITAFVADFVREERVQTSHFEDQITKLHAELIECYKRDNGS
jgi:hypothetical protein